VSTLVLLRHGESTANAENIFSGWLDVPLSARGKCEAALSGALLAEHGLVPDVVHTSVLSRAFRTADLVLAVLDRRWVPVRRSWRLNERHYGLLQGRTREAVRVEVGEEILSRWRRSYECAPPPLPAGDPSHPRHDPRYRSCDEAALPSTESLADVRHRLVPYWREAIAPDLHAGRCTLVVAHGNSLRALIMHLEGLAPDRVPASEIPTGVPLRYDLDMNCLPLVPGGVPLGPLGPGSGGVPPESGIS
jgi:2,3-bisphosphoglycerate-dependent phosphoglycerate mutase